MTAVALIVSTYIGKQINKCVRRLREIYGEGAAPDDIIRRAMRERDERVTRTLMRGVALHEVQRKISCGLGDAAEPSPLCGDSGGGGDAVVLTRRHTELFASERRACISDIVQYVKVYVTLKGALMDSEDVKLARRLCVAIATQLLERTDGLQWYMVERVELTADC